MIALLALLILGAGGLALGLCVLGVERFDWIVGGRGE